MTRARQMAAAGLIALSLLATGCQEGGIISLFPKADKPIPAYLVKKMKAKGMTAASPIMIRIYKEDSAFEVWKKADTGRFELLETYDICKWSGKLGPKFKEGDRQAPEGFYTVNTWQMNPKSDYYLSFNIGFPNAFDRANNRTGSNLMVHGACSSAGCYSMTDERIGEIYALAREAFKGGQKAFQIEAFPFRMTPENMALHKDDPNFAFWKMLKVGADHFEITGLPPKVDVCDRHYVFDRTAENDKDFKPTKPCPDMTMPESLALAYAQKVTKDERIFEEALRKQALLELFTGRKPEAPANMSQAAMSPPAGAAQMSTPQVSAGPAPRDVVPPDQQISGDIPVPEPSPLTTVEAPPAKPKKNWLQRLFSPKG